MESWVDIRVRNLAKRVEGLGHDGSPFRSTLIAVAKLQETGQLNDLDIDQILEGLRQDLHDNDWTTYD